MALTSSPISLRPAGTPDGAMIATVALLPDADMPAGGWPITPALYGLTRFKPIFNTAALPDPSVDLVVPEANMLFTTTNKLLLPSFPVGGSTASPTTDAVPFVTAGATPVTSGAATGPLTPGIGKAVPTHWVGGANYSITSTAIGYV